jgi:ABC-type glycerol-3-phosphate transport system substrate-binding protein
MAKKKKIRLIVIASILALCLIIVALGFLLPGSKDSVAEVGIQDDFMDSTYIEYLDSVGYTEEAQLSSDVVTVDLSEYTVSETMNATDVDGSVQLSDRGDITWSFNVEKSGYYNLKFNYTSVEGTTSNPQRTLLIDDKSFFDGMKQIDFVRTWDNGEITSKGGNEIRPTAQQIFEPLDVYASDTNKRTLDPYVFYLEEGEHTITLAENREPLQINAISFEKAPIAPTYEEYLASNDAATYIGENIVLQAERYEGGTTKITKSSTSVGVSTDYASSYTYPYHHWNQLLNIMGGSSWANAGEAITWYIDVPTSGYYQISVRARQNTNRGVKSFRRIKINGEVPFKEASKIGFDYSTNFENYVLSKDGEPLLFYLNEGENTLNMEVVLGDFANSLSQVEDSVLVLNNMYRKVVQITGTVPDSYIDYEIDKKVPGFKDTMAEQAEILYAVVDELVEITGEKGSGAVQIEKVARECAAFAEKPDDVVDEISTFKSNISALGTWMLDISSMPLEVDSFTLSAPGAKLKSAEPNAVVAAYHEAIRFGATFFVDSTQIASDSDVSGDAIKVWIATGRDQAQIIRNLVDGDYSPSHEKSVNLQLIPSGVLLPATLSGNGPDVSLSNAQSSVVDFAVRGALADLSKMEGFDEYSKNFYDSAIQTASYNGGVYGLPETQSFSVLFYRSDILEELGLDVPKTWSDVENAINILHINNYDFYIPTSGIYTSLVYQYGGDVYLGAAGTTDPNTGYVYDASGSDYGIQSGLREEPAMLAFKKLTEFFTTYALPVSADFSNRFRTGEIPLGIADYTLFNTLEIFAPEIRGLWNFAPLPGYEREDGTVDNTSVSTSTHTVILDSSKKQEDAWEFVRWWLSEDVQVQYGNTLEAILGSGARYATANPKVLTQLPWATRQSDVILEQFENTKGIPDVPGYYMTSREIDYAFKDVVTDGQNPREALYLNVKEINDELTIKREEFHLTRLDEEGNVIDG